MSDENPRKATDVLLAIEARIDLLSKSISNMDNNIKSILNKLASNNIVNQPNIPSIPPPVLPQIEVKSDVVSENEKDFDFPQVDEIPVNIGGKKVAVQQRVVYPDGKNVCLALVEIKDSLGSTIKKMRTNAMGKWMSVLEIGNYNIRIVKAGNKNKADVELNFPISISESDRPIELPSPKYN